MEPRHLDPWTKTECDECGWEFMATRAEPKTFAGGIICGECESHSAGRAEGAKERDTLRQQLSDTKAELERVGRRNISLSETLDGLGELQMQVAVINERMGDRNWIYSLFKA